MKKIFKGSVIFACVLICCLLLTACGNKVKITDGELGTKLSSATITSWYGTENQYLDTSVNIDFDQIDIENIVSVKFTLANDDAVLGTAISEGENLATLLADCEQYWNNTGDYKDTTGVRTMSCAFSNRTTESDNGYWVRSACSATNASVPSDLKVEVIVSVDSTNQTRYTIEK